MAAEGVFILLLPGDFILLRQVFRRFHHPGNVAEPFLRGNGLPGPFQTIVELLRAETAAPAGFVDIILGIAHAFHAAGKHRIGVFGLHQHGGVQDGLQARGTAPVELVAGNFDRQVGFQAGQAANGRVLAAGIAEAQDDIIYFGRIDAAAGYAFLDDDRTQIGGGHAPQPTAKGPHGSSDRRYYGDSAHLSAPCPICPATALNAVISRAKLGCLELNRQHNTPLRPECLTISGKAKRTASPKVWQGRGRRDRMEPPGGDVGV